MLSLFRKRMLPACGASSTPSTETPKGLTRTESAASLLATPRTTISGLASGHDGELCGGGGKR